MVRRRSMSSGPAKIPFRCGGRRGGRDDTLLKVPRHSGVGGAVAVIIEDQKGVVVIMRVMIAESAGTER